MKKISIAITLLSVLTLSSCGTGYETRPNGTHDTEEMVVYTPADTSVNQRKQPDPEENKLELNEENDNSAETTVPVAETEEATESTVDLSGLFDEPEDETETTVDLSGLFD